MKEFEAVFEAAEQNGDRPDEQEAYVRAEFWAKLGHIAKRVPFADDLLTVYYCAMDPATPARARAMLFGALAYFIMPVDAIPDAIVGLGYTDDAAVIATAIALLRTHVKPRHRAAAAQALGRDPAATDPPA